MRFESIPSRQAAQRTVLLVLTGMLLLLSALSMRLMATNSFWYDEVWSLRYAGGAQYGPISLIETLNRVSSQYAHEKNPPGYYLMLNVWGRVAGWSEFAGWAPSMLAGLICVALMYRLGQDLAVGYGHPAATVIGLSAAVALGLSAFFIQYFYEMRAYVFVVLLAIGAIWIYWRLLDTRRNPGGRLQLSYVLIVGVMLYTHYTLLVLMVAVGLYHLLCVPKNARWWRVALLTAIGCLTFVPWGLVLLNDTYVAAATSEIPFNLPPLNMSPGRILETFTYMFSNSNVGLLAFLAVFALIARDRPVRFAWFVVVAGLLIGMLISIVLHTVGNIRYLIALWPVAALLVAFGIDQLRRRAVNPVWILAIWTAAGLWNYFNPSFANMQHEGRLPWKTFRAVIQEYGQPDDLILFHTPIMVGREGPEFAYYAYGLSKRSSLTESILGRPINDEYLNAARQYIGDAPRVWLGAETADPANFRLGEVQRILSESYQHCFTAFDANAMRLELYARNLTAPQARFGDPISGQIGVGLLGPLRPQADKTLSLVLGFSHPATTPPDTYSVGVHVVDESGQLRAQSDFGLAPDLNSCRMVFVPINALPPGKYTVLITVYDWRTGQRLPGQLAATGVSADRLPFGSFTMAP
jgi:hypothetical protein